MSHLRLDPTRTTRLRAMFNSALKVRIDILKRELHDLLIKGNAFGLVYNAEEWRFHRPENRLAYFRRWFDARTNHLLLGAGLEAAHTWVGDYVKQAYERGLKRSYGDWKKPTGVLLMKPEAGAVYQKGALAEFMRQSFGGPTPVEKANVLASRVFNDLRGVTEQTGSRIGSLLLDAVATGLSPRDVGKELNNIVDGYKNRGLAIARTEIIRAFNSGALDALENLGAKEVGVMVEWTTSGLGVTKLGNLSPCPKCAALSGLVLTVDEARGLLPRHVNCSCSIIPANVGEKSTEQVRDASRIRAALARSAGRDTRWVGSKVRIATKRPA